jgi:hypothetical protein
MTEPRRGRGDATPVQKSKIQRLDSFGTKYQEITIIIKKHNYIVACFFKRTDIADVMSPGDPPGYC